MIRHFHSIVFSIALVSVFSGDTAKTFAGDSKIPLRGILYNKLVLDMAYERNFVNYLSPLASRKVASFISHSDLERSYTNPFRIELAAYIRDPRILNAITYENYLLSRSKEAEQKSKSNIASLIAQYYYELFVAIAETAQDPRLKEPTRIPGMGMVSAGQSLSQILTAIDQKGQALNPQFAPQSDNPGYGITAITQEISQCISQINTATALGKDPVGRGPMIRSCIQKSLPEVKKFGTYATISLGALDLRDFAPTHPGQVVSRTGYIGGNRLRGLDRNRNTHDPSYTETLEAFHNQVILPYEKKWEGPAEVTTQKMAEVIREAESKGGDPIDAVFDLDDTVIHTDANGEKFTKKDTALPDHNPIWRHYGDESEHPFQTFPEILAAIRSAKSTVFIDVFFLGGTTGLAIAHEIITQLKAKPALKIYVLQDLFNHFGHESEMHPIFHFLRAYSLAHPDGRLLVAPSNIKKKYVNGYPSIMKDLVSTNTLKKFGLDSKFSLYLKAQSDHSKVVVVDGDLLDGSAKAIVSSKNWTDASGPLCNDEALFIQGPAAVVLLQNYYSDLYQGIKREWSENAWTRPIYQSIYASGWTKGTTCAPSASADKKALGADQIEELLCPLDILGRSKWTGSEAQKFPSLSDIPQKLEAQASGTALVHFAENNSVGSQAAPVNQDVYAILNAKKQILINDQYLYSDKINRALIAAAKRGVEIKAILEPLDREGSEAPNMPNLIYLDLFQQTLGPNGEHPITIKFKKHIRTPIFEPEHHGKTISVDGWAQSAAEAPLTPVPGALPVYIAGSANKDILTMKGGFRETQAEVFDREASRPHDELFWKNWYDSEQTELATFDKLMASPIGKQLEAKGIPPELFMSFVRSFVEVLYSTSSIHSSE